MKTTDDILDLRMAIKELQEQVSCGCMGHKISVVDIVDDERPGKIYGFKCIFCDVKYYRRDNELTEHEKSLVKLSL
jgi:hypothetical protein